MNDAGGVSLGEPVGNGNGALQRFHQPHPLAWDHPIERLPRNVLHDYEVDVIFRSDVVNGDNVRMIQGRGGLGFLHKPLSALGVGRLAGKQNLDGDHAPQPGVASLVNRAHSALSQFLQDFVMRQRTAQHLCLLCHNSRPD